MARDDWYRNESWDADIEAVFRIRLARSRGQGPQYLKIQAGYLAASRPEAALGLIEEYFATGDQFAIVEAHCVRAQAYEARGELDEAVGAYKSALAWETAQSKVKTQAWLRCSRLIVDHRLSREYDWAWELLTDAAEDQVLLMFPADRYEWNGCCALLLAEMRHTEDAREFAERALRAAAETESRFRYHRKVGLVRDTSDEFGRRLKRLARPSKLRALFRLIVRE
jgi:Tfp pilus assembly protein PilF